MKLIWAGSILAVIFFVFAPQFIAKEGIGGDAPEAIIGMQMLLLIPGVWLIYAGVRGRYGAGTRRHGLWLVIAFFVTLSPIVIMAAQGFIDEQQFSAVVKPLRQGSKSPAEIEPALLQYVEHGRTGSMTDRQRRVVKSLIGYSIPGTEPTIITVWQRFGGRDAEIGELLLNSGNPQLEQAARGWAQSRGIDLTRKPGSPDVKWRQ